MKKRIPILFFTLHFILESFLHGHDPARDMTTSAKRFIQSLGPSEKKLALFSFDNKDRENWHFFPDSFIHPKGRKGLAFRNMTPAQKLLAHKLLSSALSHRGLLEAVDIMLLEQILFDMEGKDFRDIQLYYVSIFGTPQVAGTWGWRLEGHHLSLNFSLINGRVFSVTPSFFGASPQNVKHGQYKGMKVLVDEEAKARTLFLSLSPPQKKIAILSEKAPRDIISGQDNTVNRSSFLPPQGLPITMLNSRQKKWLEDLIFTYSAKHRPEIIKQISHRKPLIHPTKTYIAWAGSLDPGKGHYYRVQTPEFLFEYANTQNDVNHAHAVWRDFNGDFGRDLLRNHYQQNHDDQTEWENMFNGKTLEGWKANEDQESFSVQNGCIVAKANNQCHLFYQANKPFKNFVFEAEVMTLPHSNSGIYFHTRFQDQGWPRAGFEYQINNTYHDPKKTASIYGVQDCLQAHAIDDKWFKVQIKVNGKRVITKVDDKVIVDWTQPEDWQKGNTSQKIINEGTFALQGNDPESTVLFRSLRVKRLP
jgi:hypothetical protein